MSNFKVVVMQGVQGPDDPQMDFADQALDLPASDEQHQWVIWKEIAAGYENDPHWKVDTRQHGYIRFRHVMFPTIATVVYTTLQDHLVYHDVL